MCRSEPPTRDDLACRWRLYRHRARHFPHLPTRSVGPVSAPHAHRPVRPGAFLNRITPSRWCLDAARDPAQQRRTGTSPGSPQNTARLAESHAANPTRGGTPGEVGRPQQRVHPGNVVPSQHRPRHRPIPQLRPRQPVPAALERTSVIGHPRQRGGPGSTHHYGARHAPPGPPPCLRPERTGDATETTTENVLTLHLRCPYAAPTAAPNTVRCASHPSSAILAAATSGPGLLGANRPEATLAGQKDRIVVRTRDREHFDFNS